MTLRFLTGVAIVAAVATGLVRRYRKQLESAGTALAADAATTAPARKAEPAIASPVAATPAEPSGASAFN